VQNPGAILRITTLYKIESLLHNFFIVFWGICLFSILGYLFLRGKHIPIYKFLFVLVACFIAANLAVTLLVDHHLKAKVMNIDPAKINALQFLSGPERATITDKQEIVLFINCLQKSMRLPFRHTSPLKKIYFCFNKDNYYYSIANDSKIEDAFWLFDESCPNCVNGRTIYRFQSKKLSTFMAAVSSLLDGS
jgi:hypothetical protein